MTAGPCPNFMLQALTGQPLTIYGDGQQTRSFCYVDDTVRGLVGLLRSDEHQPVNVGNPNEITIREIAERVIEITGRAAANSSSRTCRWTILKCGVRTRSAPRRPSTGSLRSISPRALERTLPWFESQVAKMQAES